MGLARETGGVVAEPCSTASEELQDRGSVGLVRAASGLDNLGPEGC